MESTRVTESNSRTTRMWNFFVIDVRMLPSKIAYLLFGGILGSHVPFLYKFFISTGLSHTQAGLIAGIRFAPSSISGPLWGMLADYTGKRKLIMITLCLGSAIPLFSMPWVSQAIYPDAYISANSTLYDSMHPLDVYKSTKTAPKSLFYVLLCVVMLGSICVGPLPGYVDSLVMNVVKTGDYEVNYGTQRIFGSLGFSIASFVAGVASDMYKNPRLSQYTAVFFIFLPYTLLLIPVGYYLVGQTRWDERSDQQGNINNENGNTNPEQRSFVMQLLLLFRNLDVIVLVGTAFISGLACNVFLTFSLSLVEEVTRASETEKSLLFVIATIAEVGLFPFTGYLITILGGTSVSLTLGIFSYFIRFLVMSYTAELWLLLLVQVLHGIGFALHWSAMMEYLHQVSPKVILLTVFLIFQSIQFGIAALIANVVGGALYQSYGGKVLFRGKAVLCGVWTVIMVIYYVSKRIRGSTSTGEKIAISKLKNTVGEDNDIGVVNQGSCSEENVTVRSP